MEACIFTLNLVQELRCKLNIQCPAEDFGCFCLKLNLGAGMADVHIGVAMSHYNGIPWKPKDNTFYIGAKE